VKKFGGLLSETMDDTMRQVFGETASELIYTLMERHVSLKREEIGEKIDDPLKMYLSDIFTISTNLAGIPGISIPCGFTKKGLPVGLQIMAKPFNEEMLFRVAYAYEQNTPWHLEKPKL